MTLVHDPLTFDEETHTYRLDGQVVPSVTQVIRPLFASSQQWWKDEHRERGQKVHEATAAMDRNMVAAVGSESMGYVDAYQRFRHEKPNWTPLLIEQAVYSERYRFAGTLDRVFSDGEGTPILLDIKTSKTVSKATALQLAAYEVAFKETYGPVQWPFQAYALHLSPDGKYRLVRFDDMAEARQAFLAALTLFNWRAKNGC